MDALHTSIPIETNYSRDYLSSRPSIERLVFSMARLASQHGLGALIIDEVQDLSPRGSRAILSFLVQLVNTIGAPVIIIGGVDAIPILTDQFRQARRGAAEGDLIIGPAEPGSSWRQFCEVIWKYQYTQHETPLTQKIVDTLYDESQGITHYLVLLYKLAQIRAISTGIERVTPAVIRSVARDSISQAAPVLREMKRGNTEGLLRRGDVLPPDGIEWIPFLQGDSEREIRWASGKRRSSSPAPTKATEATSNTIDDGTRLSEGQNVSPTEGDDIPLDQTMIDVVDEAQESDKTNHEALKRAGLIDDALWREVAGDDQ
jgi:hypothetical protein